jgi:hypothetical protein
MVETWTAGFGAYGVVARCGRGRFFGRWTHFSLMRRMNASI